MRRTMCIMPMAISPHSRMLEEDVIGDPAIYPDAATLKTCSPRALPPENTARS